MGFELARESQQIFQGPHPGDAVLRTSVPNVGDTSAGGFMRFDGGRFRGMASGRRPSASASSLGRSWRPR